MHNRAIVAAILAVLPLDGVAGQEPTSATPTAEEAQRQVQAVVVMDTAAQRLAAAEQTIRDLQERIDALESRAAQTAQMRAQIDSLKTERDRQNRQRELRETDLRRNTIPEWLGNVGGLATGLSAVTAIGSVAEITLAFDDADGPWWTKVMDMAGRITAGAGGVLSLLLPKAPDQTDALRATGAGIGMYYVGSWLRRHLAPDKDSLQVYVERVSMHGNFAADVRSLNRAAREVNDMLAPLKAVADQYMAITPGHPKYDCKAVAFIVKDSLVIRYASVVDSYNGLVTQLLLTNKKASDLKSMPWTAPIAESLDTIISKTNAAIVQWRNQVLISNSLLANLQTLAQAEQRREPPPCPAPSQPSSPVPGAHNVSVEAGRFSSWLFAAEKNSWRGSVLKALVLPAA